MGCFHSKIQDPPGVPYSTIINEIRPFDLILFRGSDCVSKTIKCTTKSNWSHCGIVMTTDVVDIKNGIPNKLYIWEATIGGCGFGPVDVETDEQFLGTQFRDLEAVVNTYLDTPGTAVAWCPLITNPIANGPLSSYNMKIMKNLHEELHHQVYPLNVCYLLGTIVGCCRTMRVLTSCCTQHVFCSELVSMVYLSLGVVPPDIDPADVTPGDFVTEFGDLFQKTVYFSS